MCKRITYLASAIFLVLVLQLLTSTAAAQQAGQESFVEEVEIRGNRRIPRESILYYVQSKPNDRFDQNLAQRDLQAILQLGFFDPLATKLLVEDGSRGGKVIIFQVKEYPIIREIRYPGLKSATESEVLTMWKERRVQISKESTLDPAKANGARNVLREVLAEKGHPDAKVDVEIEEISATTVALVFNVDEGPRVRVKEIVFVGANNKFSQRSLRGAMKLVKESGLFSTFTSKDIYFKDKLLDDIERVHRFLGSKGYLQAKLGEPKIEPMGKVTSGIPLPLPLLRKSGPGLRISVPVEVGRRYRISKVEEKGVSFFQPGYVSAASQLRKGELVDANKIAEYVYGNKGVKALYGEFGYIQADVNFIPKFIDKTPEEGEVEVTLEVDEGRQFSLRRLEFIGNTNTRDVVLRREVAVDEGSAYNKRLWDYSLMRLNQLGLFDEIKDKDAITRTNDRDQTVDIDLQVKEKGRQQIQLNGGVSGYAGSFFGIDYTTNNFLGYGETLQLAFSGGNRQVYAAFGFTEPYFLGKPISLGFNLFVQKAQFVGTGFDFASQTRAIQSSLFGLSSVDASSLFTQKTYGGTVSLSGQMSLFTKKFPKFSRFARVGLSYSLTSSTVQDPDANSDTDPTNDIPVTFSQPAIITSQITPSLVYDTKCCNYLDPVRGQSIYLGFGLSGGILGGQVNTFSPHFEYQLFIPALRKKSEKPQVIAMRFRADHTRSFGTPPPSNSLAFVGGVPIYSRYFLGGENDIRGYDFRSVAPLVPYNTYASTQNPQVMVRDPNNASHFIPSSQLPNPPLVDPSVTQQTAFNAPLDNGCGLTPTPTCNNIRQTSAILYPLGGDTQFIYNLEYRVPIVSVLSVAAFTDFGAVFNARKYSDQIVKSNFTSPVPDQFVGNISNATYLGPQLGPGGTLPNGQGAALTGDGGVFLNNSTGKIASADEFTRAVQAQGGSTNGFTPVYIFGDTRSYSIVDLDNNKQSLFSNLRQNLISSMGLEFRVQMPVINVPFRLIWAYNPQARIDMVNPSGYLERRTVFRFSVGRTF
jgi:outer membrane protein insertion porin family